MKKIPMLVIAAATLLAPVALRAQHDSWDHGRERDRHHDDRAGRIAGVIADLERRTDEFQVALRHALDRSALDGTRREDQLNRDAAKLAHAMDRLRDAWNADRDYERSRRLVGAAISAGQDINRSMQRHRLREHVQREWENVRAELNRLAEVFQQPTIHW